MADLCFWAVTWVAGGFGVEGVEVGFDGGFELLEAGAWEVCASDGAIEEGIADQGGV